MSVTNSAVSTLTVPVLSASTAFNGDIGTWLITLSVSLLNYPLIKTTETFYVTIQQCLLNTLTATGTLL